ncbi:Brix domain-containing protein [Cunninghamella echinulata]|nr:Brix domain-containing protein [Cunninghamella echinulata]
MAGKRKRKTKTHKKITEEEYEKVPKSFVIKTGKVGTSVTALVRDVRQIMEPNTATHLKERKTNRLKDFVAVAGQLGVTNFMIFSRTEKNTNLRICRVPRGPTLTFRIHQYALAKDCIKLQKNPSISPNDFRTSPLLVLNNFRQEGKEFKVMTAMLQNMFPSIEVETMKLSQARRVLLYNYNEETEMIDVRHYHIGVKTTGVSKSIKKVVNTHLPDLSKFEDIADYVLKEAIVSESDVEDAQEDTTVTLAQNYHGRNNRKNEQRAVRLQEIGPRMTLQLIKVENGLCEGEVLYHRFIKLSPDEIKENERKRQKTLSEKQQRREEQQANVERKQREKEEHRKRTGAPMAVDSSDEDDNDNDDNDQDEDEDINEQIMETMDSNDEDDDNDSDEEEEEDKEEEDD